MLDEFFQRARWDHATCACGWETPPCPGKEEAANFWGQHLLAMSGIERLRDERAALRDVVRDLTFDGCVSETDDTGNSAECFWCGGVLIEADCPTHGPRAGCMGWTSAGDHHPNCAFVHARALLDDREETP